MDHWKARDDLNALLDQMRSYTKASETQNAELKAKLTALHRRQFKANRRSAAAGEMLNCPIGPKTKALAVFLRYGMRVPYRKVKELFQLLFRMAFVPASAMGFDRAATRNMKDEQILSRIVLDPKVMVGKPVIKGTRLTVEHILNLLAHGAKVEEIIQEYNGLTQEDIQACLLFATRSLESTSFMPLAESA